MKKNIVIGITSGIAAYKIPDLVKNIQEQNFSVHIIMTNHAAQMISPKKFEKITGEKVHTALYEENFSYQTTLQKREVDHIKIADSADIFVIAPATANTLGKLAHGIADDFLTTTALAVTCPKIICPSMNVHMWENSIVQENIAKLKKNGWIVVHPEKGPLACGYHGMGRLANIQTIQKQINAVISKSQSLQGKNILITAGSTIEPIDDVRFIRNPSSGKMGMYLAQQSFSRGAHVLLLRAADAVCPTLPIPEKIFKTSADLYSLLKKNAKKYDVVFHVAAVSDFRLSKKITGKVSSEKPLNVQLLPQKKIINEIKKIHKKIFVVAFKAVYKKTHKEMITIGNQKLSPTIDAVVINDIGYANRGFASDTNEVVIVQKNHKPIKIPLAPKSEIAKKILDTIKI